MTYWLIKSEPTAWSWEQQKQIGRAPWDGVRNYQANNYMKQMTVGDQAFFYHSGRNPCIMGIVDIITAFYPDPLHPPFGQVDVKYHMTLKSPLTLKQLKTDPLLKDILLFKQSRLSVMPIQPVYWDHILKKATDENK